MGQEEVYNYLKKVKTYKSTREIATAIGASYSATSNAVNKLLKQKQIKMIKGIIRTYRPIELKLYRVY